MKRVKKFWIKERHNPQLGVYYSACGQLSKTRALAMENSLYGHNYMLPYDTEEEYLKALAEFRKAGKTV